MNTFLRLSSCALIVIGFNANNKTDAAPATTPKAVSISTLNDSISYMMGNDIGNSIKNMHLDSIVAIPLLIKAVEDVLGGKKPAISEEGMQQIQKNLSQMLQKKSEAAAKVNGEKNIAEARAFFEKNKSKAGVKTTASGLQYLVIKEGSGKRPTAQSKVKVHYKGTLLNGKEFDSSYGRGEPTTFGLNQVIPGWTEGIQLMTPGSNYRFFIPSKLAYGEQQMGPDIQPNAALIFDVELISIEE